MYVIYRYNDQDDDWSWDSTWCTRDEALLRKNALLSKGIEADLLYESTPDNYSHAAGYPN